MPSLVWPSVILVALLLPGLFFHLGLYAPERFSRDTAPRNPLTTLGAVVLVAIVVHALLDGIGRYLFLPVAWDQVLDTMHIGSVGAEATSGRIFRYYEAHPVLIPTYVVSSAVTGYLLGRIAGSLSVRGWIPGAIQFPWAYALRSTTGGARRINYVHVLSNVEHDGKALLYRGRLHHFGLNADGTFAYIAIEATEQRFLDLTGGDPVLRDRTPIGGTRGTLEWERVWWPVWRMFRLEPRVQGGALLMITGTNVRTVVFQGEYELDIDSMASMLAKSPEVQAALAETDPLPDPSPPEAAVRRDPEPAGAEESPVPVSESDREATA